MYFIEQYSLQGEKLVITLRGKGPLVVDVEIPAALFNEEELKEAIKGALEIRQRDRQTLGAAKGHERSQGYLQRIARRTTFRSAGPLLPAWFRHSGSTIISG